MSGTTGLEPKETPLSDYEPVLPLPSRDFLLGKG